MRSSLYGSCHLLEDVLERDDETGIRTFLEPAECRIELVTVEVDSAFDARACERMTTRVLAERQRHGHADVARVDDLVGARVLQHAVLMDARLVREGVRADHGLVRLDEVAGSLRDEPR